MEFKPNIVLKGWRQGAPFMRYKQPFTLYKRSLKSGKTVYYYQTYDEFNRRTTARSTGCTLKSEALRYCLQLYKTDQLIPKPNQNPILREYAKNWYIYDICPYIQNKLNRGYNYTRSYADTNRSVLIKHILPTFGKYRLNQIRTKDVENWLARLRKTKKCSLRTLNHYLVTLRVIFNEAERQGEMATNPLKPIKPFSISTKEKGIFTIEQIKQLFASESIDKIWNGNLLQYLINYTALNTGMRMGEIMALQWDQIHEDHIEVKFSWNQKYGLKPPKNYKTRTVPLNSKLRDKLQAYKKTSTSRFVFSFNSSDRPIDHKAIQKWFKRAIAAIGIDESIRQEKNISFHSWRHTFVSLMRNNGAPDSVVMLITGHQSREMQDHYTHGGMDFNTHSLENLVGESLPNIQLFDK